MLKRTISIFAVLAILFTTTFAFAATTDDTPNFFASDYLESYLLLLTAKGNGKMLVTYSVDGTGYMTKIGAESICIEEKVGNSWREVNTYYGSSNSDFYSYNALGHLSSMEFSGVAGRQYRATMVAYAGNNRGNDTRSITCTPEFCK